MSPRIAVTGGSGFIGTNVMQFYIDKGVDVFNIDIAPPQNRDHLKYWHKVDILDISALKKAIYSFSPDYLIHLAAKADLDERHSLSKYDANIKGINNIIASTRPYGKIKRVIFASSMLVCRIGYTPRGPDDYMPNTLYGESKVLGEKIIRDSRDMPMEWVIVRPTSVWGPWFDEPYKAFFDLIIKRKYAHMGTCSATKTFGYVKNAVFQIDRLLFSDNPGIDRGTFYLGDYTPIKISEWADQIAGLLGGKPFRRLPLAVFKAAARTGDFLKKTGFNKFPMTSFRLKNMTEDNIIELSDIRRIAPSLPYSVKDGIKETLQWMGVLR